MPMKSIYRPPNPLHWQGRTSADQAYIHENVELLDLNQKEVPPQPHPVPVLMGYACDEGVARNSGRTGAAKGPEALRHAFGKMPLLINAPSPLWDAGDLICAGGDLESTQKAFAGQIERLISAGYLPMAIGGGHDIAFAHYLGLRKALGAKARLGILNFDAHFDLRKPLPLPHSGSPFLQIKEQCQKSGSSFLYACVGVRKDANPQELWDRAESLKTLVIPREALVPENLGGVLNELLIFLQSLDALYLTIDMDGFSSAFAPGVSAASPMGYAPESIVPCLELILTSGKLISMDIAELNPSHDRDGQTAALAASLLHKVLHHPGLF